MKRLYLLMITVLICSLMLFGCDLYLPEGSGGLITEDGDTVTDGESKQEDDRIPETEGNVDETEGSDPENNENKSDNQDSDPENSENGGEGNHNGAEGNDEQTTPPENEGNEPLPEIGTKVGDRFADLTIMTMDGGSINTADLRGKIVILNLWATWCPPCKAELPDFDLIASEYKDHVVIIAADVDAGTGNAHSYVQQNFPESDIVFAYDSLYGEAYFAAGGDGYVPYTAIMDQNGVIVYTDSGMLSHSMLVSIIEGLIN